MKINVPGRSYAEKRKGAYPSIEDQLDALWKGGVDFEYMKSRIKQVKEFHVKPGEAKKP
jgi:hypothetical protein